MEEAQRNPPIRTVQMRLLHRGCLRPQRPLRRRRLRPRTLRFFSGRSGSGSRFSRSFLDYSYRE
jgi:hypothetical protein